MAIIANLLCFLTNRLPCQSSGNFCQNSGSFVKPNYFYDGRHSRWAPVPPLPALSRWVICGGTPRGLPRWCWVPISLNKNSARVGMGWPPTLRPPRVGHFSPTRAPGGTPPPVFRPWWEGGCYIVVSLVMLLFQFSTCENLCTHPTTIFQNPWHRDESWEKYKITTHWLFEIDGNVEKSEKSWR